MGRAKDLVGLEREDVTDVEKSENFVKFLLRSSIFIFVFDFV